MGTLPHQALDIRKRFVSIMKFFVVYYTEQEYFKLYHIASTKEKAEGWVKRHKEENLDIY